MLFDIDIPDNAKWIAQDLDGSWYWYAKKPYYRMPAKDRMPAKEWLNVGDSACDELCVGSQPANWTEELYKVIR